jgi:site-specific DNA recombinase
MRNGEVDIILAEALDRLSRDQEHIAALHKLAAYTGVRLVTLSEGEVGSSHVGLRGAMSAMYLEDLVAKTMRSIEGRVHAGRAMGAPPYGYRRTTAVLRPDGEIEHGLREIEPEHAAVVRRNFECFAGGMTPGVIARMLNTEGVPAPRVRTGAP